MNPSFFSFLSVFFVVLNVEIKLSKSVYSMKSGGFREIQAVPQAWEVMVRQQYKTSESILKMNNENLFRGVVHFASYTSTAWTFSSNKQQEVLIQCLIEKVTWVHRRTETSWRLEPPLQEEPRRIARLKVIRRDNF